MKCFTLVDKKDIHIAPDTKVIPAKEFSLLLSGNQVLKKVQQEALEFKKEVVNEGEKLKERAEIDGFQKGLEKWNAQLELLEREIKNVRNELESALVPLALTAVKKIIGRELEVNPDIIVDIVATALKSVSQHKKISIYVNQQDLERLEKNRSKIKNLFEHLESLTIAARTDISIGSCIIETEAGILNVQLENQLEALKSAFEQFFQKKKQKGPA